MFMKQPNMEIESPAIFAAERQQRVSQMVPRLLYGPTYWLPIARPFRFEGFPCTLALRLPPIPDLDFLDYIHDC